MKEILTQERKILMWLERGRKITALQALMMFGCLRLASRIYNIRKKGYLVSKIMIETKEGKHVAQYRKSPTR